MEKTTKHHRHPKSLRGPAQPWNLSIVDQSPHYAWHILFGNAHVAYVAHILTNEYLPMYNFATEHFVDLRSIPLPENICKKYRILEEGWEMLFGNLSIEETLECINGIWVTPRNPIVLIGNKIQAAA